MPDIGRARGHAAVASRQGREGPDHASDGTSSFPVLRPT